MESGSSLVGDFVAVLTDEGMKWKVASEFTHLEVTLDTTEDEGQTDEGMEPHASTQSSTPG